MPRSPKEQTQTLAGSLHDDRVPLFAPPELLTDKILRPTPLIAMWQDWADNCCRKSQPLISLMVGLTAFSSVMGGAYRGPTWSIPQLMNIVLAPPGGGKDTPMQMAKVLLHGLGLQDHLGADKWGSSGGLERELEEHPNLLAMPDEFADMLDRVTHPNCPSYIKDVFTILKTIYTGNAYAGTALKDGDATKKQRKPRLAMVAIAQPKAFWAAVRPKIILDGFISRFTVLSCYKPGVRDHTKIIKPPELCMPKGMIDWINAAIPQAKTSPAVVGQFQNEQQIPYADRDTERFAWDMIDYYDRRYDERYAAGHELESAVIARSFERAIKLAAVYAWTERQKNPSVTKEALEWANTLVTASDKQILTSLGDNMSDDKPAKQWAKYKAIIQGAGENGIAVSVLIARTKLNTQDHASLVKQMTGAGCVRITQGPKGGAKLVWVGDNTEHTQTTEDESDA